MIVVLTNRKKKKEIGVNTCNFNSVFHAFVAFEGWWSMQKSVEHLYQRRVDPTSTRVEHLRKFTREQFAVMHFSPQDWGNNTKRKLILSLPDTHASVRVLLQVVDFIS